MNSWPVKTKMVFMVFMLVGVIYLVQLFFLQVVDTSFLKLAENNAIRSITTYPMRGLVYDRDGKMIVSNEPVYDIMVTPRLVKDIDTLKFCELLKIDKKTFDKNFTKAKKYSRYRPSIFLKQVSKETFASYQEFAYQFPGFFESVRTLRSYPSQNGAHILGYIGEVNKKQIEKNEYYKLGDYIGSTGIEHEYEEMLRGEKGLRYVIRDVFNREQGSFDDGNRDLPARSGTNLQLSIDIELQEYGEKLMQNKIGSIVAIEPSTGEILALVSSPNYDPNILNGRQRGENFTKLSTDTLKPMFNRAIMAKYTPGSIFKPFVALIGLQEGAFHKNKTYICNGSYWNVDRRLHCSHSHVSCRNVQSAIKESCNPWFWQGFKAIIEQSQHENAADALLNFSTYLTEFGFGRQLKIDLPNESKGDVPSVDLYNGMYGPRAWKAPTIISLGIGQGELGLTPLQMANSMAIIANRGYYYYPHIVKPMAEDSLHNEVFTKKREVSIDPGHFVPVIEGLDQTVKDGTAKIARVDGLDVVGKTGTADNPHGKPHSVFTGFAPKNNPQIAIAVVVENSGFGSTYGAPIASLMIEKYMNDSISFKRNWVEERMLDANLLIQEDEDE